MKRERRVAVVAALKDELAPLASRLGETRVERHDNLKLRFGELAGSELILAVTGDGEIAARRGAARLLEAVRPDVVFAIGIAGGLSPGLETGQVVMADRVLDENGSATPTDPEWLARGLALERTRRGTVLSATRIAVTPEEKTRLHRRVGGEGVAVVDLESVAYVGEAASRGIPVLVARAVCDTAEEKLPLDFNEFRTAAGGVSRGRVLRHALTHPGVLEGLMGLRARVHVCARSLAGVVLETLGSEVLES